MEKEDANLVRTTQVAQEGGEVRTATPTHIYSRHGTEKCSLWLILTVHPLCLSPFFLSAAWPVAGYWSFNEFVTPLPCRVRLACPGVDPTAAASSIDGASLTQTCSLEYAGVA